MMGDWMRWVIEDGHWPKGPVHTPSTMEKEGRETLYKLYILFITYNTLYISNSTARILKSSQGETIERLHYSFVFCQKLQLALCKTVSLVDLLVGT